MKDTQTPEGFREARKKIGVGQRLMGRLLNMGDMREKQIGRYERGESDIPGPTALLVHWIAYGKPQHIKNFMARDKNEAMFKAAMARVTGSSND